MSVVVNRFEDALPLDLGEDVEATPVELYKVLVGACADGTPITHICETTDDSPPHDTVHEYLTDRFDLEPFGLTGHTLLQQGLIEILSDRPVEVVADLHLDPYYGDEDKTTHLYSSEAKQGTTTFQAYTRL